jgi:glutamate N-acetyltransferase / amino-acid N-acetyltransferase
MEKSNRHGDSTDWNCNFSVEIIEVILRLFGGSQLQFWNGEGATALFEVKVVGAESIKQAKTLAKSVVCSNLTKAAIAGHDANWGRILCAMGYSGVQFDPEKVDLFFESKAGKLQIIENGVATDYSEEVATKILSEPEITATADIKMGDYSATAWGCDLTHEYININADYRS